MPAIGSAVCTAFIASATSATGMEVMGAGTGVGPTSVTSVAWELIPPVSVAPGDDCLAAAAAVVAWGRRASCWPASRSSSSRASYRRPTAPTVLPLRRSCSGWDSPPLARCFSHCAARPRALVGNRGGHPYSRLPAARVIERCRESDPASRAPQNEYALRSMALGGHGRCLPARHRMP